MHARQARAHMPPTDLLIRRATEADLAPASALIGLGAVEPGTSTDGAPADLPLYRAALREIDATGGVVLVAQVGAEVVGLCQLVVFRHLQNRGGLCAEIESVHVHPHHRGGGVGSALVRDAVERARALGCYRVQLTSSSARADAHRFYERLGFVPSHVGFKMLLS